MQQMIFIADLIAYVSGLQAAAATSEQTKYDNQ